MQQNECLHLVSPEGRRGTKLAATYILWASQTGVPGTHALRFVCHLQTFLNNRKCVIRKPARYHLIERDIPKVCVSQFPFLNHYRQNL